MRLFYAILFLILLFDGDCPKQGDSPKPKLQALDTLKNRTQSGPINLLSLNDVFTPGDDTKRFSSSMYVDGSGYVFDVKHGGSETCNCHSKDKTQLDIHIEIVQDLKQTTGTKRMVIEVNRYTIAADTTMRYDNIRKLIGKHVEFKGWMFFDEEHKQNAFNTSPQGTNLWRATCWEVHPCISIKEIQ